MMEGLTMKRNKWLPEGIKKGWFNKAKLLIGYEVNGLVLIRSTEIEQMKCTIKNQTEEIQALDFRIKTLMD